VEEIRMNHLLKQLKAASEQYDRYHVQDLGITCGQCIMLHYLLSQKPRVLYATDIHMTLGISKATISAILKSLKKKGYLIMEEDARDDRRKRLVLTEKALEMQPEIEAALRKRGESMCKGISKEELMITEQVLCRMLENLKQKTSDRRISRYDKNTVESSGGV